MLSACRSSFSCCADSSFYTDPRPTDRPTDHFPSPCPSQLIFHDHTLHFSFKRNSISFFVFLKQTLIGQFSLSPHAFSSTFIGTEQFQRFSPFLLPFLHSFEIRVSVLTIPRISNSARRCRLTVYLLPLRSSKLCTTSLPLT